MRFALIFLVLAATFACEPDEPLTLDGDGDGVNAEYDCNDGNPDIFPGATERCNDIDDNCDGDVDEGLAQLYWQDLDGDGFGSPFREVRQCNPADNVVGNATDCDDDKSSVYPGADEVWYNGIDEDCEKDNDFDQDGDGHVPPDQADAQAAFIDTQIILEELPADDCDDTNNEISPEATEICGNGLDDDCNEATVDAC